ncbi:MAG: amidohydrolase [Anaerolineae bacterium]|nr:amidohydrolase [Anaerolineae bacterium]
MTATVDTDWMAAAEALADEMIARRRDLHRHPELAFEEVRTAGIVARELGELGLEVATGVGRTGVVGVLEGASDGPTVLVRCDMDALPIAEANQTDYVSEMPGKMHACGHDGHTAIGLAVAKMLAARRDRIAGRIKFMFQPAEEIAQGAMAMIDDGVLESPAPQVALGLHLWNEMPVGVVGLVDGPMMASANTFEITVRGRGGHGAMPDQTRDPLLAGAHIVTALQSIVSRNVSGLDTAALSVCSFNAGFTHNVIPAEARLTGTFRTYRQETNDMVSARLREIAAGVAAALGVAADVALRQLTPPLINDAATNRQLRDAFARLNLEQRGAPITWDGDARTMASEDMACILARTPGTFLFVGSANAARGLDYAHHHPRFDFDERALALGAGLLAAAVAAYVVPA